MFTAKTIDKMNKKIDKKMRELILSGIAITKWCHCKMSKEDKQRDIAEYERWIKEEEKS
jgi:hypothetical protein